VYEIVLDLETTVKGPNKSPEAQYEDNYVVAFGHREPSKGIHIDKDGCDLIDAIDAAYGAGQIVKLIGHNLKFDVKHLMKKWPDLKWEDFEYHDTMYTEYRQSGHRYRFPSLEDSCARHSVVFKKGLDLGDLIANGVEIEDIPDTDLLPYLRDDVRATYDLYCSQINEKNYIEYDQAHIPCLAEMELLGLPLDVDKTETLAETLYEQLELAEDKLWDLTTGLLGWDDGSTLEKKNLKFTSARTVSYILTGEPIAGLTKRVRKNIDFLPNKGPMMMGGDIKRIWGSQEPTHLGYKMSKKEVDEIAKLKSCHDYMEALLFYRKLNKLLGTYISPFLAAAVLQPTIHPKMNVCTTATGRLSSSAPNGQNLPEIIRQLFKSEHGKFHEIDFKQLEVVALAHLSGDPQLLLDIQNGEDIHFNTGKHVFGWVTPSDMTDKDRKLVKNVNFGLIYGGGPGGLSKQTGQPMKLIKRLIKAFYSRYPGVADWQDEFFDTVVGDMKPNIYREGESTYHSTVTCPTSHRKFYFKEERSPEWLEMKQGRKFSFKPTETKNYPVQGFAGGDIVMVAMALLWQKLRKLPKTDIRMTVHDSILVDTDMDIRFLQSTMKTVCLEVQSRFSLPFNLGFDISSGLYWQ
jgi:DNA polymerase I-like protein with 3'-5' exonuclease and polymerase domains